MTEEKSEHKSQIQGLSSSSDVEDVIARFNISDFLFQDTQRKEKLDQLKVKYHLLLELDKAKNHLKKDA